MLWLWCDLETCSLTPLHFFFFSPESFWLFQTNPGLGSSPDSFCGKGQDSGVSKALFSLRVAVTRHSGLPSLQAGALSLLYDINYSPCHFPSKKANGSQRLGPGAGGLRRRKWEVRMSSSLPWSQSLHLSRVTPSHLWEEAG